MTSLLALSLTNCDTQQSENSSALFTRNDNTPTIIISDRSLFLRTIEVSKKKLNLGSYKLHTQIKPNDELINALKTAQKRGVDITVIVEDHLTPEEQKQVQNTSMKPDDSYKIWTEAGIRVKFGQSKFGATHEKILISDSSTAIVGNTNFDKEFKEQESEGITKITRDFSLILTDPKIIQELSNVFEADIAQKNITLPIYTLNDIFENTYRLSWGPDQHLPHFLEMIENAKISIDIYQQALQDDTISKALQSAAQRGVYIRVLMSQYPFGEKHGNKSDPAQQALIKAGGHVKLTGAITENRTKLHIHAKVMIVDKSLMYLGSANFFTPALTNDRQVGVITRMDQHITPLLSQFEEDWNMHEEKE